ncbi:hypothetical protein BHE74_00038940, partial [Ensete ventricosum]
MAKHRGESSMMEQAGPLPQAVAGGLQVQTHSQAVGAAHEKRDNEQDEREVGYSPRVEEAQSGAPIRKRSHKERLTTVETHLNVLETSLEELYQGKRRLPRVESSHEEAESRIDRVESLVDRMTEDTKDSVQHLHEVVTELTSKVSFSFFSLFFSPASSFSLNRLPTAVINRRRLISAVPPDSGRSAYRSTDRPVHTTRYRALSLGKANLASNTLVVSYLKSLYRSTSRPVHTARYEALSLARFTVPVRTGVPRFGRYGM